MSHSRYHSTMGRKALPRGTLSWALGIVIRARLHSSQRQLADDVGVSKDTLERWLSGQRAMTVDNLASIAQALGVRPAILVSEAQEALLDAALNADGKVTSIIRTRLSSSEHDGLEEDLLEVADHSPDEDALRDERGEW